MGEKHMRIQFDAKVILQTPYDAETCREAARIVRERASEMSGDVFVGAYLTDVPGWNSSYFLSKRRALELAETIEELGRGRGKK